MFHWSTLVLAGCTAAAFLLLPASAMSDDTGLQLTLRSRVRADAKDEYSVVEKKIAWDPKKTVLIICDMWDDHWCKSAARRVGELAGPMNDMVKTARSKGVLILHAP